MAKTRIKNVDDLPKWFDLRKYDFKEATAVGWFFQFAVRSDAITLCVNWRRDPSFREQLWDSHSAGTQPPLNFPWIDGFGNLIAEDPFLTDQDVLSLGRVGELFTHTFRQVNPLSPGSSMAVHPTSVEELYLNEGSLRIAERSRARKFFRESSYVGFTDEEEESRPGMVAKKRIESFSERKERFLGRFYPFATPYNMDWSTEASYESWFGEPLFQYQKLHYPTNTSLLTVDLSLPDNLLVEEFKSCLESLRKKRNVQADSRFTRPDFDIWISQGVLPYIDLKLWAFLNNLKISNPVYANALYADGLRDAAAVRRTTAKTAAAMISVDSPEFLKLKAYAARRGDSALKKTNLSPLGVGSDIQK